MELLHHRGTEGFLPDHESLTHDIIGAAIEVHRGLGPGLLESAYSRCLAIELEERNLKFAREVPIPVQYKGVSLEVSYRADFVVQQQVLLEIKSVQKIEPIHKAQLLTYLKLTGLRLGLLINFNVSVLRVGISRIRL